MLTRQMVFFDLNPPACYFGASTKGTTHEHRKNHFLSSYGIPFSKANLSAVLSLSPERLWDITKQVHNPLIFSLRLVGVKATLKSAYLQAKKFFGRKKNGTNI